MTNTFIQIHTLTGYSGVLLNRDDVGLAKRLDYGAATRTRTSSQFAKRKLRLADGAAAISNIGDVAVRSREVFKRKVATSLIEEGLDKEPVVAVTVTVMDGILPLSKAGVKKRKEAEKKIASGDADALSLLERDELNVLTRSEIEYIKTSVRRIVAEAADKDAAVKDAIAFVKNSKDNLKVMREATRLTPEGKFAFAPALDVAMFGRMVTGDVLSSVDAAVGVAHAITTHRQESETDFFTAVDDLVTGDEDHGSAHMGETELTSPLLYGYYVVDWNQLLDNLAGADNAEEIAAQLVRNLITLASTSIVGAKKGGTAPFSSADFVMVEIGGQQPRTLAEAFRKPAPATLEGSIGQLVDYVSKKDGMHPFEGKRFVASMADAGIPGAQSASVPAIAQSTAEALKA